MRPRAPRVRLQEAPTVADASLASVGKAHRMSPATLRRAEAILMRAGRVAVPIHRDMISRDMALGALEELQARQVHRAASEALRRARYAIVRLPVVRPA